MRLADVPAVEHQPDFAGRAQRFSRKVRHRHDELALTESQLVERTGLSRDYLQKLLNQRGSARDPRTGECKPPNPTLDVIWRLADALDLDPMYLATTHARSATTSGSDEDHPGRHGRSVGVVPARA